MGQQAALSAGSAASRSFAAVQPVLNSVAAAAAPGEIQGVVRGSALAGFEGGDFLAFDIDPGVGGPGFYVGYVSDLDDDANQIPASADGASNEVLTITAEAPPPPISGR